MDDLLLFFFFNDTATTEIYTLSLHDALPIYSGCLSLVRVVFQMSKNTDWLPCRNAEWKYSSVPSNERDRKSTRLNSSHSQISYAVFCLKKTTPHAANR